MLNKKDIFNYYGHDDIELNLLKSIKKNKLHHGLLFVGPDGVGKSTFALRLSASLLSKEPQTSDKFLINSDNLAIRRILAGTHGDFRYIEPDSKKASNEISVDQIRSINKFFSQTSMEGGWRIAVIDGKLNRNSANALLKSLEEPPKDSLIILIAKQSGEILPTIRSRCQIVKFKKLTDINMSNILKIKKINNFPANILPFCEGSPGKLSQLYDCKANKILNDIKECLSKSKIQNELIIPFCEKYSKKPKKDEANDILFIVFDMLSKIAMEKATFINNDINIEKPPIEWVETYQCIIKAKNDMISYHLDRTQSLILAVNSFN